MELSNEKRAEYSERIMNSKLRILIRSGFYGLLLSHMKFGIDPTCDTAYTDGENIVFGTNFLDEISDPEIDFILMHEIMHVVLRHCNRTDNRDNYLFNVACDIVVNSNILLSEHMNKAFITLDKYGESMHEAPDGKEGYNYTAEQVYDMLIKEIDGNIPGMSDGGSQSSDSSQSSGSGESKSSDNSKSSKGDKSQAPGAGESSDSDSEGSASGSGEDADGDSDSEGSASSAGGKGKAGKKSKSKAGKMPGNNSGSGIIGKGNWDDHSHWKEDESGVFDATWIQRLKDACKAISIRENGNVAGSVPYGVLRVYEELTEPKIDWRTVLTNFIQEEIVDYSFNPPDRRFDGADFMLPDFNEKDEVPENILFMIDTSGSMSDESITDAFSEIKGAIDQFNGRLKGWLGFFDAAVVPPVEFETFDDIKIIRPQGGGGTSFQAVFDYVRNEMNQETIASIIILTDGYCRFPDESESDGIPVLWIINNDKQTPPWGKVVRI
ncbi:MAG: VWA-like domain-containing protein [Clostridia bacterium]|nr:VWA-like domain-containing protein [Clostridia bacterium]